MSRFAIALALCSLPLAAASTLAAATGEAVPAAVSEAPVAPVGPASLQAAIADALALERAQIDALAGQLATAPDDAAALALHRAIEKVKMDGQLRVLGLQVEFARREGRLDDAARLEAAVDAMGRLELPAQREARPAPDANQADGR